MLLSMENINIEQSKTLADLTCELARTCNEKELHFAKSFNLAPAEFKCLREFGESSELPVKELCQKMQVTPGRITHILTTLEEKSFLYRQNDPLDKRNVIVHLTRKSIPFIKNINDSHIKIHSEILNRIPPENREAIISAMEKIIEALKEWSDMRK